VSAERRGQPGDGREDPGLDQRAQEVLLEGGTANRGRVVRIGDTVRRPLRATSAATHALLRHLADAGFAGAPRVLGVDDDGREVLSYVRGTAVTPPCPLWALTDEALVSVAVLLRDYHRAVSTFDPAPYAWPATSYRSSGSGYLASTSRPSRVNRNPPSDVACSQPACS